ncbi:Uncharacterized protein HZ326_31185 [Fusarium oxysporum f. sp. albedinis]|nr:Uncharacterized protein HZ326_31185 [Fusarium oxysporum f. sp. albedinis]
MSRARITTIVNNFAVAMNSKSQAASCCLDDRQIEHEYKRPTLVAPLDRKSSAHLILAVHPCMRYQACSYLSTMYHFICPQQGPPRRNPAEAAYLEACKGGSALHGSARHIE